MMLDSMHDQLAIMWVVPVQAVLRTLEAASQCVRIVFCEKLCSTSSMAKFRPEIWSLRVRESESPVEARQFCCELTQSRLCHQWTSSFGECKKGIVAKKLRLRFTASERRQVKDIHLARLVFRPAEYGGTEG